MKMKVKDGLPAIGIRIYDDPVPLGREPRVLRDVAREREERSEQAGIRGVVERPDMRRGNDQQMSGSLRIQILERQHSVAALDDRRRDFTGGNFAKDAGRRTQSSEPPRCRRLGRGSPCSSIPSARRTVSQNLLLPSSS